MWLGVCLCVNVNSNIQFSLYKKYHEHARNANTVHKFLQDIYIYGVNFHMFVKKYISISSSLSQLTIFIKSILSKFGFGNAEKY